MWCNHLSRIYKCFLTCLLVLGFLTSEIFALPNIVIFLADDLGYGDLHYSGHPTSYTPNLDKMAAAGRYFTDFYSTSPVCSPSRAALLTGRYQVRSGIWPGVFWADSVGGLPKNETTIGSILQGIGYYTGIIGKWHLGVGINYQYLPTNHGFHEYYGIPYSHDICPCKTCFFPDAKCFDNCFPNLVSCPLFDGKDIVSQPANLTTLTENYTKRAINFIQKANKKSKPFFLYLPYQHTHHPQFAGVKFRNSTLRQTFGDSLAEMDWSVGQVMDTLDHLDVLKNTLVWFTSDNGPNLKWRERGGCAGLLRCGKGTTYEGGVRVPAIAYWKGKIIPGVTTGLASTLDILPTILGLVGKTTEVPLDGVDLASILFNNGKSPREHLLYYPADSNPEVGIFAIRYKSYKAHFYTQGSGLSDKENYDHACHPSPVIAHDPPLLFDLNVDPGERYNLGSNSEYRNVLDKIQEVKKAAETSIKWGPSEILRGNSQKAEPCCTYKGCQPFPICCDCHHHTADETV